MPTTPSSTNSNRKRAHSLFGSRTDVGCVRKHNEDSLVVQPPLFVVADGMGGHAAGEVASEIAIQTIAAEAPDHADAEALGKAVVKANIAIIEAAHEGKGREGMGTTVTAAMLEGERLIIAQVGDSRAYLLHQGVLQQLTRDHSLVADMIEAGQLTDEEARIHPNRSVITRALGSDTTTQPDLYEINVEAGDRLLLCSDGLSGMLVDDEIATIMNRIRDPQRCASSLVSEAIGAGGHDNITVIIADVEGHQEKKRKKLARKTKLSLFFVLLLFVAIVAGAAYGFNYYTQNTAYLTEDNNKVAVYRGVPGEFLGFQFSNLEYVSDISLDDLEPGVANRIRETLRVDNLEAAENLLDGYQTYIDEQKQSDKRRSSTNNGNNSDTGTGSDGRSTTEPDTEGNTTDNGSTQGAGQ